ncbi:MAG: amino acid ABC transporter permease [Limnochordia bacterium]|jgi:glutamine transport system permease protein
MLGLDVGLMIRSVPYLAEGAVVTVLLTLVSVSLGMIGGTILGMARLSSNRIAYTLSSAYVGFFRGTPLLVQIFLVYMGLPGLLPWFRIDRWTAGILTLSLNSSAYVAEIIRAGIQSIDRGQSEAAIASGLTPRQRLRYVILPQAFRRIIPPLGNEFIAMLKDSSLVAVIALEELLRRSQLVVTRSYKPFEIYILTAMMYLVMTSCIAWLVSAIEKRFLPGIDGRRSSEHAA